MENSKEIGAGEKPADEKPNPSASSDPESEVEAESASDTSEPTSNPNPDTEPPSRTPFTSLAQVDADLALARALQEQVKLGFQGWGFPVPKKSRLLDF